MLTKARFLLALGIALCTSLVLAQQEQEKVTTLCNATLAALQKTDAGPLAKLLSVQAGSFLAVAGKKPVVTSADALAGADKWAEAPLLTPAAKLGQIKSSDRLYGVVVRGEIKDGDRSFILDGVAVGEAGGLKWGMLAVVPKPQDNGASEDARRGIMELMDTWSEALAGGNPEPMLGSFTDDAMALAVVGPNYGFYVFNNREDLKMTIQEAMAQGGVTVEFVGEPKVLVSGPAALVRGQWKLDVGGTAITLDARAHLVRTDKGWRMVGFFALVPPAH